MNLTLELEKLTGLSGHWNQEQTVFRTDPLIYGYLSPVQRIERESQGVYLISGPVTHTEWWHQFMLVTGCPRRKGLALRIRDSFDSACLEARCQEACGAEDGFVDLSAGRLRVEQEREFLNQRFPRLAFFLARAERLTREITQASGCGILLDTSTPVLDLRARFLATPENLRRYVRAFQELYVQITQLQGRLDARMLPTPTDYSDVTITEASVLAEARYYALQEAVRQEALDMLAFLVRKKGGQIMEHEYYLPVEQVTYTLRHNRIEARRNGLYMGSEGFRKGVQELQQFFQTTLGGGRW